MPRSGDIHPLQKQHIAAFLRRMPVDYLYGLKEVELCARVSDAIGQPFGCYRPAEKIVRLFSVPRTEWELEGLSGRRWFELHDAEVETEKGNLIVYWKAPLDLAYFMYREVFLHELGHHYDNQYRHKKKWPAGRRCEESSANHHAFLLAKRKGFDQWHRLQELRVSQ